MKHTFLKAGRSHSEPVSGSFIYIAKASGSVRVEALASGQSYVWPDLERGEQVRLPNDLECTKLSVTSLVDDNEVVIKVGQGRFYPRMDSAGLTIDKINQGIDVVATATVENGSMSVVNDVKVNGEVDSLSANDNNHIGEVTIAAGQSKLLVGAKAGRKSVRLSIKVDEVGGVYLGKSGILNGQGGYLDVGMVDYIDTEGSLYAFNPNDTAVTIQILELNRL